MYTPSGDCADLPASKSGGVAHQEADVVAHNLTAEITGKGRPVDSGPHHMTAGVRRGPRRRKSHDLSRWLAAIRRYRSSNFGAFASDLLGQGRV